MSIAYIILCGLQIICEYFSTNASTLRRKQRALLEVFPAWLDKE